MANADIIFLIFIGFTVISSSHSSISWSTKWTSSNAGSSFATEALICNLNLDHHLELFAATVDGELLMLDLNTGQVPAGTHWPLYRHGEHFFSQPILYDIDRNGEEEVLFISHSGEISAYSWQGMLIHSWTLPNVFLSQPNWFKTSTSLSGSELKQIVSYQKPQTEESVELSPNIWSSAQIIDYNGDSRREELILAMNYIAPDSRMNASHVLAVFFVFNLTSSAPAVILPLELTKSSSEYTSYVLSSAQVADFVNYAPGLEIIISTSSGFFYVVNSKGSNVVSGFPVEYGPMEHQPVLIQSGYQSRHLSALLVDTSGNILCIDSNGKSLWEFTNKGSSITRPHSIGNRIMFADQAGRVFALDSSSGELLPDYPIKFNNVSFSVDGTVLRFESSDYLSFQSSHGNLYLFDIHSPNSSVIVDLKEPSYLPLQHLPPRQSSDMLLLSKDGVLIRYSPNAHHLTSPLQFAEHDVFLKTHLHTWKHCSYIKATGSYLTIDFKIVDEGAPINNIYTVKVYLGSSEVHSDKVTHQNYQSIQLKVDETPFRGRLTLTVISPTGFVFTDSTYLALNWHFLMHLSHLLYLPTFCLLGGILLLTITRETELLLPLTDSVKGLSASKFRR